MSHGRPRGDTETAVRLAVDGEDQPAECGLRREVQEEADFHVRSAEGIQGLRLMARVEGLAALDLDDHRSIDNEVGEEIANPCTAEIDGDRCLPFGRETSPRQCDGHGTLIDGLEKAVAELAMDLVE